MRYRRIAGAAALICVVLIPTPASFARTNAENYETTGGHVVEGTPVAVAVRGASGPGTSYERPGGGAGPRWTCGYHDLGAYGAARDIGKDAVDPQDGLPYAFLCTDQDGRLVHDQYFTYESGDPLAGLFAAERAAEQAMERLDLPLPAPSLSPPDEQVVGITTWLALADPWAATQASASVAGVTSTVTAQPTSVRWDLGDGTTVTCAGPGTTFDPNVPVAGQASDCSHTYTWPSHQQPGGAYQVVATVSYDVTWSATTGASGELGTVTRTTTTPVRVLEVQAIGR